MKPKLNIIILIVVMHGMNHSLVAQKEFFWDQITFSPENDYHPQWSHKGDLIAYTHSSSTETEIFIIDPDEKIPVPLYTDLEGDKHISWSPDDTKILFDARSIEGPPNIFVVPVSGGKAEQITFKSGFHPSWSPDKNKIAFSSIRSGNVDIWVMDLNTLEFKRLTHNQNNDYHPCWSHDGNYISFTSERGGNPNIWTIPSEGGIPTQITHNPSRDDWASWAPDDSYLIYTSKRSGNYDLWITTLGCKKTKQVTYSKSNENHPVWSPKGKKLAFSSDKSGSLDIWIIKFN